MGQEKEQEVAQEESRKERKTLSDREGRPQIRRGNASGEEKGMGKVRSIQGRESLIKRQGTGTDRPGRRMHTYAMDRHR